MDWLSQIQKTYRLGLIHNPDEFHSNSFWTEIIEGRLFLMGKHRKKNYSKVAVLKKKKEKC